MGRILRVRAARSAKVVLGPSAVALLGVWPAMAQEIAVDEKPPLQTVPIQLKAADFVPLEQLSGQTRGSGRRLAAVRRPRPCIS